MPYPKLAEGDRVFDAVFDAETNFADWNELQDQLKGMLGPLTWNIPMVGGFCTDAAPGFEFKDADPPYWEALNCTATSTLYVPLPWVRSGMKLTRIKVSSGGDSIAGDDGDGSIKLHRHLISAAGASYGAALADISLTPFRAGAAPGGTLHDSGALTLTLDGTYSYFLRIQAAYDATPRDSWVLGAYATVQFGA